MGIPKLAEDLRPYAESVVLGSRYLGGDVPCVTALVIDGPSLVYLTYSRLLASKNRSLNPIDAQPSYDEISAGVARFLLELRVQGIDVQKIYFDGALPASKRPVRLERLEKLQSKLKSVCGSTKASFQVPTALKNGMKADPLRCFSNSQPGFKLFTDLPAPPFMVPAVIEDLQDKWTSEELDRLRPNAYSNAQADRDVMQDMELPFAELVEVVPGEADAYCAAQAKKTGAAILSSDFDMLLYDLGSGGALVLLESLEVQIGSMDEVRISAVALQPSRIEDRLQIQSVRRWAFERERDSSATSGIIRNRARVPLANDIDAWQYNRFCKAFDRVHVRATPAKKPPPTLPLLDPRLAELYCQYKYVDFASEGDEDPQVYLPFMVEQHSRDSSWSYGASFRELAYSLLNLSVTEPCRFEDVSEFQRRGDRIVEISVPMLSFEDSIARGKEVIDLLHGTERAFDMFQWDALLYWRLFAYFEVSRHKQRSNKPQLSKQWILDFLRNGYVNESLSWYDIHVYANIQAVLYSVRMLKQVTSVVTPFLRGHLSVVVKELNSELSGLPRIADLMAPRDRINGTAPPDGSTLVSLMSSVLSHTRADEDWDTSSATSVQGESMEMDDQPRSSVPQQASSTLAVASKTRKRQITPGDEDEQHSDWQPESPTGKRRRTGNNMFEYLNTS